MTIVLTHIFLCVTSQILKFTNYYLLPTYLQSCRNCQTCNLYETKPLCYILLTAFMTNNFCIRYFVKSFFNIKIVVLGIECIASTPNKSGFTICVMVRYEVVRRVEKNEKLQFVINLWPRKLLSCWAETHKFICFKFLNYNKLA